LQAYPGRGGRGRGEVSSEVVKKRTRVKPYAYEGKKRDKKEDGKNLAAECRGKKTNVSGRGYLLWELLAPDSQRLRRTAKKVLWGG